MVILTWLGSMLWRATSSTFTFFIRLLRDAWVDTWKRVRPKIIKLIQFGLVALLLILLLTQAPAVASPLLAIGVMVGGLYWMIGMVFPKKKKKK